MATPPIEPPPLPHAYPFLLIDRMVELVPGSRAVAVRNLACDDPLLDADGRLPPVLLAEALAQCAGVAVAGVQPGATGVLAAIERFRARPWVAAGDQLRISVRVVRVFGAMARVRGVIRAGGRLRAAGDVVLQIAPHVARGPTS